MTTVESDLRIIKMFWMGQTYQIKVGGAKLNDKQDIEKTYATDSHKPNRISFGKMEFSLDLSDVQSHRWLFIWIRERQQISNFKYKESVSYPNITAYKYNNKGKLVTDFSVKGCFVTEITEEDVGLFDVKLDVMNRAYRGSDNKLY